MWERLEAGLGAAALNAMRVAMSMRMGVRTRTVTDTKGRTTPWIEFGSPVQGTVVWIHGFNDRPAGFLRTALHLWRDFRVVAPAVPGFFEGWIDADEVHTVEAYGRWLAPVLQEAVASPCVLVGNSLGGAIALELAAAHQTPALGVVALNPAGMEVEGERSVIDDFAAGESPFEIEDRSGVNQLFSRLVGRPIEVPFPFEAALYREMREQRPWYARLGADLAKSERRERGEGWSSAIALSKIDVPVLVLWGERDTLFPVSHGEQLAMSLPHGRLERLSGIGHIAHVESPGRLAAHIRHFALEVGAA